MFLIFSREIEAKTRKNIGNNYEIFIKNKEHLKTPGPYFVFKKVLFTHPYYDNDALSNQINLANIQNKKNILFCGSYFGYGFHEDGIKSSIDMMNSIND